MFAHVLSEPLSCVRPELTRHRQKRHLHPLHDDGGADIKTVLDPIVELLGVIEGVLVINLSNPVRGRCRQLESQALRLRTCYALRKRGQRLLEPMYGFGALVDRSVLNYVVYHVIESHGRVLPAFAPYGSQGACQICKTAVRLDNDGCRRVSGAIRGENVAKCHT